METLCDIPSAEGEPHCSVASGLQGRLENNDCDDVHAEVNEQAGEGISGGRFLLELARA